MCLRTDGQWRTWMDGTDADAGCAPYLAVWGEGSAVCLGSRPASQRSPYTNYLRLGWWSTDRPLPMNDVSGRECSIEVGHISVFMHPATLAVDNGRAPHFRVRHEEVVAREGCSYAPVRRVLGLEPLSLRTHRHRGRSRPLRSAVVEYQAPSVAVWLQLCARTGLASGHLRHHVMQGSPPAHRTPLPCLRTTGQIWHGTLYLQGAMTS